MISHADCDHSATKSARAQCRRTRDAGMRGVRNSKRAQQLALERPESSADSLTVRRVKLSKDKLFAGIWVRLRASQSRDLMTDEWRNGHLLSAMNDNVRVVLDDGTLVQFRWGEYELEQEIYTLESAGVDRRRRARYYSG